LESGAELAAVPDAELAAAAPGAGALFRLVDVAVDAAVDVDEAAPRPPCRSTSNPLLNSTANVAAFRAIVRSTPLECI
jgi:hypothetical protein